MLESAFVLRYDCGVHVPPARCLLRATTSIPARRTDSAQADSSGDISDETSGIRFLAVVTACFLVVGTNRAPADSLPVELVGQFGGASCAVAVEGNRTYLGVGLRLVVLDISQPSAPTVLGQSPVLPDIVRGVAVSGGYAYVADGDAGLQVIDISNPAAPVRVAGLDTSDSADGVAVSGGYAYVADWTAGLQVINISNPAAAVRVAECDTNGNAAGVAVSGAYAYVADVTGGLQVIDISDPAAPVRVGGYDTSGAAEGVAVSGGYAYVVDGSGGLVILRVGSPAMWTDFDDDGDVDLSDFAGFQGCFNGPNRPPRRTGCTDADADSDADVDLADFTVFATCFNGPNRPAGCG
jgi:hypothetical protein